MIKDTGSKFVDYSILPKIRQMLLHSGYELNEKDFYKKLFLSIRMSEKKLNFDNVNVDRK